MADFIYDLKIANSTQTEVYSTCLVLATNTAVMLHLETGHCFYPLY